MKAFLDSFWICWALRIHVVQDIHVDPCGSGKGGGAIYHRGQFCNRTVHFLIHDHHCFRVSSLEIYKLLEPFHLISLLCCAERKLGCFCKLEIQLHLQTAFAGRCVCTKHDVVHHTSSSSASSLSSSSCSLTKSSKLPLSSIRGLDTKDLLKPVFFFPTKSSCNSYSSTDSYLHGT